MEKVDKQRARKEYNAGNNVFLLPSKAVPGSIWIQPFKINKNTLQRDFETVLNEYAYYNCSTETGKRVTYYLP